MTEAQPPIRRPGSEAIPGLPTERFTRRTILIIVGASLVVGLAVVFGIPKIREHLGKAWEAYRGRATGPSGVGLRAYLEARGTGASTSEVAALKELNSARRVLTDIRAIGLSEYEASIPRRKLLDAIRPQGMAEKDLVEAVFGAPVAGGS